MSGPGLREVKGVRVSRYQIGHASVKLLRASRMLATESASFSISSIRPGFDRGREYRREVGPVHSHHRPTDHDGRRVASTTPL